MSIHEISLTFAAWLARETRNDHRQELYIAYGLEILLGEVVKLICIILLSWVLGILPEVLIITVTAGILRLASGGEHCSAYYRCLLGGTTWFLLLGWGVQQLNAGISQTMINLMVFLLFGFSVFLIFKYAPGETANKPIKGEAERAKFKKWSICIMGLYAVLLLAAASFLTYNYLLLPIAVGIFAQAFTVSPAGYTFIRYIDRIL